MLKESLAGSFGSALWRYALLRAAARLGTPTGGVFARQRLTSTQELTVARLGAGARRTTPFFTGAPLGAEGK